MQTSKGAIPFSNIFHFNKTRCVQRTRGGETMDIMEKIELGLLAFYLFGAVVMFAIETYRQVSEWVETAFSPKDRQSPARKPYNFLRDFAFPTLCIIGISVIWLKPFADWLNRKWPAVSFRPEKK